MIFFCFLFIICNIIIIIKKKAEKKFYEPSYIYVKDYFFSFLNEFK